MICLFNIMKKKKLKPIYSAIKTFLINVLSIVAESILIPIQLFHIKSLRLF